MDFVNSAVFPLRWLQAPHSCLWEPETSSSRAEGNRVDDRKPQDRLYQTYSENSVFRADTVPPLPRGCYLGQGGDLDQGILPKLL